MDKCKNILEGVDDIFENAFRFPEFGKKPQFRHRAAQNWLKREAHSLDGFNVSTLDTALAEIKGNYERRNRELTPSDKNWRLQKDVDYSTKSHEVSLERTIVSTCKNWWNQVPVASGLVDSSGNKHAKIDLVNQTDGGFDFVELKWNSDNAVYATVEILRYALIYLFSLVNKEEFDYMKEGRNTELMRASRIQLQVLAPRSYYEVDGEVAYLNNLQNLSNDAISDLSEKQKGPKMSFRYKVFPNDFNWDPEIEESERKKLVQTGIDSMDSLL